MNKFCLLLVGLLLSILGSSVSFGQCTEVPVVEAVRNGSFEAGYLPGGKAANHIHGNKDQFDFHSDLSYGGKWTGKNGACIYSFAEQYGVGRVEFPACLNGGNKVVYGQYAGAANYKDHTLGTNRGFSLILDFNSNTSWKTAWAQRVDVYGSQKYYFSAWFAMYAAGSENPRLRFTVVSYNAAGGVIDTQVLGTAPVQRSPAMNWKQFNDTYNTPANAVECLVKIECDPTGAFGSDDILIDDISFINGCQNIQSSISYQVEFDESNVSLCLNNGSVNAQIKKDNGTNLGTGKTIKWYEGTGLSQTEVPGFANMQSPIITTPGTYRACVVDAANSGCTVNSTIKVTKALTVNISDGDLCYPSELALNTGRTEPGLVHSWSVPSGVTASTTGNQVAPKGGTYEVTVNLPGVANCTKTSTATITSSLPANPGPMDLCLGNNVELGVGNGNKFTWLESDRTTIIGNEVNATSPAIWTNAPTTAGNYQVSLRKNSSVANVGSTSAGTWAANRTPNANVKIRVVEPVLLRGVHFRRESWAGNANVKVVVRVVGTTLWTTFWQGWAAGGNKTVTGNIFLEPGDYEVGVTGGNVRMSSKNGQATGGLIGLVSVINPGQNLSVSNLKFDKSLACEPILVDVKLKNCCIEANITSEPSNDEVCVGEKANFSVVATGGVVTYQWQVNTGSSWVNTTGSTATTANYRTANVTNTDHDNRYRVKVIRDGNCTVISAIARLSVNALPTVTASSNATNDEVCANDNIVLTGGGATSYVWNKSVVDGVSFTPSSTTYTVTGTDANSCISTALITVTVNALPTVTASSNATNDEVCANDNIVLTGGGATSYIWDKSVVDGVAFTPSSTTYTVTGTVGTCFNTGSVTVKVNDLPDATLTGTTVTECAGNNFTISADLTSGVASVSGTDWEFVYSIDGTDQGVISTGGDDPYILSNSSVGVYTLKSVTDGNGCVNTSPTGGNVTTSNHTALAAISELRCDGDSPIGVTLTNTQFQIVVNVTDGSAAAVTGDNGVTFTEGASGVWHSTAINESDFVNVSVGDVNGCSDIVFINQNQKCSCPAKGSMSIISNTICTDGVSSVTETEIDVLYSGALGPYNVSLILDGNTTAPIETQTGVSGGVAQFTGVNSIGTYTVLIYDQDQLCEVTASGSEILGHYEVPDVSFVGNTIEACTGTDFDMTVNLTSGESSTAWDFVYNDGSSVPETAGPTNSFNLLNSGASSYSIESVTDGHGCLNDSPSASTIVTSNFEEVVGTAVTLCDDESPLNTTLGADEYQIVVTATKGDLATLAVTASSITFTETSFGSGVWYSNAIDEKTSVDVHLTDGNNCNGGIDILSLQKTCSCPIIPVLSIVGDSKICDVSSTTLKVDVSSSLPKVGDYILTLTNPDNSTQNQTITSGGGGNGEHIFTVSHEGTYSATVKSVADGGCEVGTGIQNIEYYLSPTASIVSTQRVTDLCEGTIANGDVELTLAFIGGDSPFSIDIINTSTNAVDQTVTIDGDYVISTGEGVYGLENGTYGNNCSILVADIIAPETVSEKVVPTATPMIAGLPELCSNENASYLASGGSVNEYYLWTVTGGGTSSSLVNNKNDYTAANSSSLTTVDISVDLYNKCYKVDGEEVIQVANKAVTFPVTIHPNLTPSISIVDVLPSASVCEGEDVTIEVTSANAGASPTFTFDGFSTGTTGSYTYFPSSDGAISIEVNVDVNDAVGCFTQSKASVEQFVSVLEAPVVTLLASTNTLCEGEKVVFTATVVNAPSTYSYQWHLDGIPMGAASNNEVTLNLSSVGSNAVYVAIDNHPECSGATLISSGTENVEVYEVPIVSLVGINGEDTTMCGDGFSLNLSASSDGQVTSYEWSINGAIQTETSSVYNATKAGEYSVVAVNTNCSSAVVTKEVIVQNLEVEITGSSEAIEEGESVSLYSEVSGNQGLIVYSWEDVIQGESYPTTESISITPPEKDEYLVTVRDGETGCVVTSSSYEVIVYLPIQIPNAFTPNGDGINDTWNIEGLVSYPDATVKIYNRWGQLVFTLYGGYDSEWGGLNQNGNELGQATYYYIIDLNNEERDSFNGDISIIR